MISDRHRGKHFLAKKAKEYGLSKVSVKLKISLMIRTGIMVIMMMVVLMMVMVVVVVMVMMIIIIGATILVGLVSELKQNFQKPIEIRSCEVIAQALR